MGSISTQYAVVSYYKGYRNINNNYSFLTPRLKIIIYMKTIISLFYLVVIVLSRKHYLIDVGNDEPQKTPAPSWKEITTADDKKFQQVPLENFEQVPYEVLDNHEVPDDSIKSNI